MVFVILADGTVGGGDGSAGCHGTAGNNITILAPFLTAPKIAKVTMEIIFITLSILL